MNHFFAILLPVTVRQYIAANIVSRWRDAMGEDFASQWYSPEDYHVTLKFLGNIPATEQARPIAAAEPIAAQASPFTVRLAPPGTFPKNSRFPRVFWMGVSTSQPLNQLAAALNVETFRQGFPQDIRAYTPHITLARRRRDDSGCPASGVIANEQAFPSWTVDAFALMQTRSPQDRQNDSNRRYNTVHTFPFGDAHSSPAS